MLATPLVILVSIIASGYVLSKTKRFKWSNVCGMFFLTAGFVFLFSLRYSSGLGQEIASQIVYSAGVGIVFPGRIMAVQSAQRDDDVGLAASLVGFVLNLGQCFGLSLGIALFDNFWNSIIEGIPPHELGKQGRIVYANELQENLDWIKKLPPSLRSKYVRIGVQACSYTFLVFVVLCGVTCVLAILSKDLSFDKETETKLSRDGLTTPAESLDLGSSSSSCEKVPVVEYNPAAVLEERIEDRGKATARVVSGYLC